MEASPATEHDQERSSQGKRILVIALRYPPAGDAAAIRARNLVQNLQALGHQVRVVTPKLSVDGESPPEARTVRWLDVEHLARAAAGREPGAPGTMSPPSSWQRRMRSAAAGLAFPDLYAPWIPAAALAAHRWMKESDLVISTGGASAHIVARLIRGSRPSIVDINDLWWRKPIRGTGPLRERVDRVLERMIVRAATALIVPVHEQGAEVERRWGRVSTIIPTGFDPSDFPAPDSDGAHPSRRDIVFAGTLYTFPLEFLFDALAQGRKELGWTPDRLRLSFIGSCSAPALAAARSQGVADFVDGTPRVPRPNLLDRLVVADALLLPLFAEDPHHLPMRFFEFVGAGRPIIGVGSARVPAARLIQNHSLGMVCETKAELVTALEKVVSGPPLPSLPPSTRALFETENTRPELQRLVEQTAGGRAGSSG